MKLTKKTTKNKSIISTIFKSFKYYVAVLLIVEFQENVMCHEVMVVVMYLGMVVTWLQGCTLRKDGQTRRDQLIVMPALYTSNAVIFIFLKTYGHEDVWFFFGGYTYANKVLIINNRQNMSSKSQIGWIFSNRKCMDYNCK